ncbi:hypothetical protein GDO86_002962 [Hymenochirus boettgeri]|uniref:Probable G-protein coupled receptor 34 n=1 Tax=Hymenochirus boettgeri TaxID=247094 RepID=A0A8T2K4E7_9PIPI|nr:hypothetical protein GDO86_002962 [Hymenochirus boettgeri]
MALPPNNTWAPNTLHLKNNFTIFTKYLTSGAANDSECAMDEITLSIALAVVYIIIFVIGLLGNGLAIYVFVCLQSKRNSVQVYLINTAIADLLLIICLPFRITYHLSHKWKLGAVFCKVVGNIFYMNMYMSIVLLGLISMDRYVKVKKSQRRHKVSNKKCSIWVCCLLWAIAVTSVFFLITTQSIKGQLNSNLCFQYTDRKDAIWQAVFNYFLVVVFWIVFLLLILSYLKISKKLFKISRERSHLPNAGKYSCTAQKSFFVLIIFSLCFAPYHTFRIVYITSQLQKISCRWMNTFHKTNEIMLVFSALNSCLDPVMYFLLSSSIRKTVFQLLRRASRDSGRSESNTSELHQGHILPDFGSVHNVCSKSTFCSPDNSKRCYVKQR